MLGPCFASTTVSSWAALDGLNFKATTKVSASWAWPLRSLQQKREVASFAAGAPLAAVRATARTDRPRASREDRRPTRRPRRVSDLEQLGEASITCCSRYEVDEAVAVLAFAVGEEFPAAAQCRRLLEERPEFTLPSLPEGASSSSLLVPKW